MKNTKVVVSLLMIFAVSILLGCANSQEETTWFTDWSSATEKATEKSQNIVIFFSNIEADERSSNLNESFNKKSFQKKVAKNYVLMNANFSTDMDQMDYDQVLEYNELANTFAVQYLPYIIIVTPEKYVIGAINDEELYDNPGKVISKIASYNKKSVQVTKLRKELEEVEPIARMKTIDKLIQTLDPDYGFMCLDLFVQFKELDPEDECGYQLKYAMNFAYFEASSAFEQGKAQEAVQIFLDVAQKEGISKEDSQSAYYTAAYLAANTGIYEPKDVVEFLDKAIAADPKSKNVKGIQQTRDYIVQNFGLAASVENAPEATAETSTENTTTTEIGE